MPAPLPEARASQEIVTGDAVVVDLRVAEMPSRVAAILIDVAAQFAAFFVVDALLRGFSRVSDPALNAGVAITLSTMIIVGYPVTFETLSRGRSLGKLALGLRVVSVDGSPERFRQALFRGLAGLIELWGFLGAPALITSLISRDGKRLGDLFSGTIVISDRITRRGMLTAPMPAGLAGWASGLELSQLTDDVAESAREYLLRREQLSPRVRAEMSARICGEVAAATAPPAPPGVPPDVYLTAVLAERRQRSSARLAAEAALAGRLRAAAEPYGPKIDS